MAQKGSQMLLPKYIILSKQNITKIFLHNYVTNYHLIPILALRNKMIVVRELIILSMMTFRGSILIVSREITLLIIEISNQNQNKQRRRIANLKNLYI